MKKKFKSFGIKSLAALLSVIMMLTTLPLAAFAIDFESGTSSADQSSTDQSHELIAEAFEVKELREESVKHFRLEDGSYVATQYEVPVHYLDSNGEWQDIDNSLSDIGSEYSTSSARIKFAKKITGNESLFTLHDGNRKITMSLNEARKKTVGKITNIHTEFDESTAKLQKMMTLDKLSSKIMYEDILDGVDLEYVADSVNIKENIIVKEKKDSYSYTFKIKLNNLDAKLNEDGSVTFFDPDTQESVYYVPAPIVYDAKNNYASAKDAYYTLIKSGNNIYSLTVSATSDWMNAEERAFPVVIDPAIYTKPSETMTDSYVDSQNPNSTYYTFSFLAAGHGGGGQEFISYLKMNTLPTLPADAYINSVNLELYCQDFRNHDTSLKNVTIGAYKVTSDWASGLTWNTYSNGTKGKISDMLDYIVVDASSETKYMRWDITSLYKQWIAGTANYGIALKTTDSGKVDALFTSENATSNRPRLVVQYRDMKGLESYWSYSNQNAGIAGTGHVNHATGTLTLAKSLLSTTDSLFPYTPTITYNSAIAGKPYQYPNVQAGYATSYMPYGFKLNINETIIEKKYVNEKGSEVSYFIWTDADGTEHYFYSVNGSTSEYEDEDGLQLKLKIFSSSCTITDDSKTVKTFYKINSVPNSEVCNGWYLINIADKNGNKISFSFDGSYRPTGVRLTPKGSSQINYLTMAYNSSSMLYIIWNQTTKEAIILRYSSTPTGSISTSSTKYLREIIYAHGNSNVTATDWLNFYNDINNTTNITVDGKASYTYNSSGRITKIKDELSGYEVRYTYSGNKVTTVQEYANSTSAGQKIGFSYYNGYTEVRNSGSDDIYGNSDDLITRYTFDKEGRAVGVYSTDSSKTQIYGASAGEYESESKIKNNIKTSTVIGGSATNFLLNGGFENLNSDGTAKYWTRSSDNIDYSSSYDTIGGRYGAYFAIGKGKTDYIYQCTSLPAGTYTLSMSINTFNCKNVDVYVTAQSLNDSTHIYTEKVPINEYYASGECSFFSMNFNAVNYNSTGNEAFKIIIKTVGGNIVQNEEVCISVDNIMLEENIGNSNYSLVQLGNFEKFPINESGASLNNIRDFWINDSGSFTYSSSSDPFGSTGYLSGSIIKERYMKQTVYQASDSDLASYDHGTYHGSHGKTYIVSGFAKGTGQVASSHSTFRLRVDVAYYAGRNNKDVIVPYCFDFQTDCKDWQFVCGNFNTIDYQLVHSITIYCEYAYQPTGYAMFDNISIVQSTDESVVKYEYYGQELDGDMRAPNDKLDGLVRSKTAGYYKEVYEYNNDRQLIRTANNLGEIHDYTYGKNGITVDSEIVYTFKNSATKIYPYLNADPDSVITKIPQTKTNYTYNTHGQITATNTYEVVYNSSGALVAKSGTKYIYSSKTYNTTSGAKIFGALLQETDSLNRKTRYYYNTDNGRLLACVNVDEGNGTCYTYDAVGNIVSVMPAQYVSATNYSEVSNAEAIEYGYNGRNMLESITTKSTTYNFIYDVFGNTDSISVGNRELAEYEYNSYNGKLKKIIYGNGFAVRYVYDKLDNIKEIWYTNSTSAEIKAYEYTYTAYGQLYRYDNLLTGKSIIYKYDTAGKLTNFIEYDTDKMVNEFSSNLYYNEEGKIDSLFYSLDYSFSSGTADNTIHYYHSYTTEGMIDSYSVDTDVTNGKINYTYDTYHRLTGKIYDFKVVKDSSKRFTNTTSYTFSNNGSNTSAQIASFTSKVNSNAAVTSTYTYDKNGNITKIVLSNGQEYRYVYDDLGQLIREDNSVANRTYVYSYDNAGNIRYKRTYLLTSEGSAPSTLYSTYSYGYNDAEWGDLLTSYRGVSITYDNIGNPLSYYNGSSYNFTWKNGRQLSTATKGSNTLTFDYNDEGIRTKKNVNGVEHIYYLSGSQIEMEKWGSNLCVYLYDADGSPIGMQYRTTSMAEGVFYTFWFEKNLQGDIIAVYNDSGVKVLIYTYDAWGNILSTSWSNSSGTNIYAQYNPFRYRGYYYDTELGMYYLQSRYYDPAIGRFINSDGQLNGGLLGYNQFAYCSNNPIMNVDPNGHAWWHWALAATVVVACAVATVATCGGFAAAATAVGLVASGTAAATASATVAAGALIGSATVFGMAAMDAAMNSSSVDEFMEQGNWGTVVETMTGGFYGGYAGYQMYKAQNPNPNPSSNSATSSPCDGNYCFVAGTLIETECGSLPIEQIAVGMMVYATNPETGETELKEVVNTFIRESSELIHITVNGEEITTTPTHPFWVPQKGWTDAIELRAGDRLQLLNGEYVIIEQVQHEILESPVTVYNFEVEDFHTYYITDSAILVHNANCGGNGTYEKAPYHNKGNAVKSPAPINGQGALDNSVQIKATSPTRVGISDGQIVMLPQTTQGVYHGYVVSWDNLTQAAKNALYQAGMTDLKGRILR